MRPKNILLAIALFFLSASYAQNVGVGNTSPNSKLDVSGDLALREGTGITVSSGNNIITLPSSKNSVYRLTGATGAFTINAISAGNDGIRSRIDSVVTGGAPSFSRHTIDVA